MNSPQARWWVVIITIGLAASAGAQAASTASQAIAIPDTASYVYKTVENDELRLYVFQARGASSHAKTPAIIFFFGGGWTTGSVTQFVSQARYFAGRGMVAVLADYRIFSRQGTSPFEAIADAKSAVRWVRAHAAELGIDPHRIAAAGGSSGGHIALCTAVIEPFDEPREDKTVSSKPDALLLFNPVVDTTRALHGFADRFGGRNEEASPVHHLHAGLPPTLILHGKSDIMVPYSDVERFCRESKNLGNQCALVGYEGATHGFFNPNRAEGKWYRQTLLQADRFLTAIGYLHTPTPAQAP